MTKTPKTTSKIDIMTLVFTGRYNEALEHADLITRWKVLSLLGLNRLDEAEQVVQKARATGENDAVAYLAAIHRLRGESRAWLLESKIPVTSHFEYCLLLRETAAHYFELQKFNLAEEMLERAIHMTSHDEDTRQLLPSLAQGYATTARFLGHDAATIPVLRDGLNVAIASRRRPLLVELAYTYALLGDVRPLQNTLEEIKVNPPAPETVEGLITAYAEARLLHLQGDIQAAYNAFEALHHDASEWQVHMSFYAAVWGALTQLEPKFKCNQDDLEPYAWLMLMRDHASYIPTPLAQGWMTCIEAIIERNPQTATRAAELFEQVFAKREECFARALPAVFEVDKINGQPPLEHVMRESMADALEIAFEIQNYAPIKQALRFSNDVSALNKYLPSHLKTAQSDMPLIVRDGKVFKDGAEQRLTRHAKAVQIIELFKKAVDGVSLDDVLKTVYAEFELENSRKYWNTLRPILEREARVRFERRKIGSKHLWFMLTDRKAVAVPQKVA